MVQTLISGWEKRKKAELLQIPFGYGQVYERKDYVFDALISAAGAILADGDFKPLMKLGAQTVLEREIQTLRACGVHEITIITGRRAEDIRAAAAGPESISSTIRRMRRRKCLIPSAWGFPIMRKSGKRQEKRRWMAFFFPVDVPLFTPFTLE